MWKLLGADSEHPWQLVFGGQLDAVWYKKEDTGEMAEYTYRARDVGLLAFLTVRHR